MPSNHFGEHFRITTFGESHGPMIGVVIDGCPAGLEIVEEEISQALRQRATGFSPYTSKRKEPDQFQIVSGVFEGKTTGSPLTLLIPNRDHDPSKYEPIRHLLRPGHANATYLKKYGRFDYRGGGRASARETVARVAAAAIAKKLLEPTKIEVIAYLVQVGTVRADIGEVERGDVTASPLFCPDRVATQAMEHALQQAIDEGDSLGGIVEVVARGLPAGLGDPIYRKLEAELAHAMLSIPATKGFEIGEGFRVATMKGSEHNDTYGEGGKLLSNHSGGILGGISSGAPLCFRVAFKPASSIGKTQSTATLEGKSGELTLPKGSRHDPCVAIRGVAVVEAMTLLVLADRYLAAQITSRQPIERHISAL